MIVAKTNNSVINGLNLITIRAARLENLEYDGSSSGEVNFSILISSDDENNDLKIRDNIKLSITSVNLQDIEIMFNEIESAINSRYSVDMGGINEIDYKPSEE